MMVTIVLVLVSIVMLTLIMVMTVTRMVTSLIMDGVTGSPDYVLMMVMVAMMM